MITFIQERSRAKEVDDQIHVIWYVCIAFLDLAEATMRLGSASSRMYHALCCHWKRSSSTRIAPGMVSSSGMFKQN